MYIIAQKDWQRTFGIIFARIFKISWNLIFCQVLVNNPIVIERGELNDPLEAFPKQSLWH